MNDVATRPSSFTLEELLACGRGELFGPGNAQLPAPPMLMFDRIAEITQDGGAQGRGRILAEKDVVYDEWFFLCHFRGDPVMPGCLGLDALWQLCGFFMAWSGCRGNGRALGCGAVEFSGEIRPHNARVTYELSVRRLVREPQPTIVADGTVSVDGKQIYSCSALKAGMFDLPYEYPATDAGATGATGVGVGATRGPA